MPRIKADMFTEKPIVRFDTLEEFKQAWAESGVQESDRMKPISEVDHAENKRGQLKRRFDPENHLGWKLQDGRVPQDRDGRSMMFVVKNDTVLEYDGEKLSDGTELKLGSMEFWHQAQMGNVFAYPTGQAKPVQLQPVIGDETTGFRYSRPLEPKDMSITRAIPAPKKPNVWKQFWHGLFKSAYKKDFDTYEQQLRDKAELEAREADLQGRLEEKNGRREQLSKGEQQELKALQEQEAAEARKKALETKVENAEKRARRNEISARFNESIFEPSPKIYATEETKKEFPGRTVEDDTHDKLFHRTVTDQNGDAKSIEGFYDKEQFKDLTVYDKDQLDLDSIQVGGKTVTNRQFCAVATFYAMDPDIAIKTYQHSDEADFSMQPTLENLGFTPRQAMDIVGSTSATMHTLDTYIHPPRDSNGRLIKDGIDPARRATAEAFNAYKAGNAEPLGKLLAVGVNMQARQIRTVENTPGTQKAGGLYQSGHLVELLEADPKLKEAALKAGMEEQNLYLLQGTKEYCALDQKACEANVKLAEAARDGKELSPEQKAQYAKDIVKAQIAAQTMCLENSAYQSKELEEAQSKLVSDRMPKAGVDYQPGDKKNVRPCPDGKLWYVSGVSAVDALKQIYRPATGSIIRLKTETGRRDLDQVAEEIVKQDQLADLSPEALQAKLNFDKDADNKELAERSLRIMQEKGMLSEEAAKAMNREIKTGVVQEVRQPPAGPEKNALRKNAGEEIRQADQPITV